jgi:23S rRNA pseudouridine2604 synthase
VTRRHSAAPSPARRQPRRLDAAADRTLRLNKFLSERGLCSRRVADAWIAAGRVTVNGIAATLGTPVGPDDRVCLDGRPVGAEEEHVYLALHKPVGIDCSTDRRIPDNILDFVNHRLRIFPVGRLDKDSEGLILLTNDGDIVNELLRVEHGHEKEYRVTVDKPVTDEFLAAMSRGVRILGQQTRPARSERIGREVFRIVLTQGLNRQIRRMCAALGYRVRRLERTRIVNISLAGLAVGRWRSLTRSELAGLLPGRFGG